MAFQSLYRRYRPRRFAEVRGQADVVRALRNAVRESRVAHAYLFSGPRGTGKTSTARILAKALNCTDLREGEPCCACESCLAIEAGTSYDLQELDAASHNGVDAMRELISRTSLGSPGRTKVYILDEVHMLTAAASAALLKTLEEPPGHVVFVLATTDPQKVLPTIRSRTQHFEFHLLPADELAEHVEWVIADAGLNADAAAVEYVLRAGGGSARDTLSALDKVVAAGGVPDTGEQVDDLVDALASNNTASALAAVAGAVKRGRDPRVLGESLLGALRDVFLTRMGADTSHLSDTDRQRSSAWSEAFTDRQITAALEAVGEALRDMRQAPDERIPLELALIQLTRPEQSASLDALMARIERLERAIADGGVPAAPPEQSAPRPAPGAPVQPAGPVGGSDARGAAAEAPPPRPGRSRGADAARAAAQAAEAAKRGGEAAPPPRPAQTKPTPSSAPAERSDASTEPEPPQRPGAAPQRASEPSQVDPPTERSNDPAPPQASAPGTLPDRVTLEQAWNESVLSTLKGLTKAMYAVGRFEDTTDAAVFAVPGAVHRDKCEERRGEVEAALARHFGRPIPLRLIVDGGDGPPPAERAASAAQEPSGNGTSRPAPNSPDPIEAERLEVGDLDDLVDAPPDNRTPLDRLTDAFPGADVVEEP